MRDHPNLMTCPDCGKLCARHTGREWCGACTAARLSMQDVVEYAVERRGMHTVQEIADATGLSPSEVRDIVRRVAPLREQVALREVCDRCRRNEAQAGSDFCLKCRMELHKAFGDATDSLFARLEVLESYDDQRDTVVSLMSSIGARRMRTGRLNPVPPFKIR